MDKTLKRILLVAAGIFLVAGVAALVLSKPRPEPKLPHQMIISNIITNYVGVQLILSEQIYAGKPEELKEAAQELRQSLEEAVTLGARGMPLDDAETWTNMTLNLRIAMGPPMAWGDVKTARGLFKNVTDQLIPLIERFGHAHSQPLYVMHCSMAFSDTGADWIQGTDKLRNPYFGKDMLECGSVKKVFPARK